MIVTFCGHADASLSKYEIDLLESTIIKIVQKFPDCKFYLGAYGNFDSTCFKILTSIKKNHCNIERIFITPYINDDYAKLKMLSKIYDGSIYPPLETYPKKFAIIKRNEWMIDNSKFLICYITRSFGGAYNTFKYALRKKLPYINVATFKN